MSPGTRPRGPRLASRAAPSVLLLAVFLAALAGGISPVAAADRPHYAAGHRRLRHWAPPPERREFASYFAKYGARQEDNATTEPEPTTPVTDGEEPDVTPTPTMPMPSTAEPTPTPVVETVGPTNTPMITVTTTPEPAATSEPDETDEPEPTSPPVDPPVDSPVDTPVDPAPTMAPVETTKVVEPSPTPRVGPVTTDGVVATNDPADDDGSSFPVAAVVGGVGGGVALIAIIATILILVTRRRRNDDANGILGSGSGGGGASGGASGGLPYPPPGGGMAPAPPPVVVGSRTPPIESELTGGPDATPWHGSSGGAASASVPTSSATGSGIRPLGASSGDPRKDISSRTVFLSGTASSWDTSGAGNQFEVPDGAAQTDTIYFDRASGSDRRTSAGEPIRM